jgi:hypothetical protein
MPDAPAVDGFPGGAVTPVASVTLRTQYSGQR